MVNIKIKINMKIKHIFMSILKKAYSKYYFNNIRSGLYVNFTREPSFVYYFYIFEINKL